MALSLLDRDTPTLHGQPREAPNPLTRILSQSKLLRTMLFSAPGCEQGGRQAALPLCLSQSGVPKPCFVWRAEVCGQMPLCVQPAGESWAGISARQPTFQQD